MPQGRRPPLSAAASTQVTARATMAGLSGESPSKMAGPSIAAHGVIYGFDQIVYDPLQAHLAAVLRGIYLGHPVVLKLAHLLGHDHPAAAAEDLDVAAALLGPKGPPCI